MKIEVSNGEILDKLSILEIKLDHIEDLEQKSNVKKERDLLKEAAGAIDWPQDIYNELRNVNWKLWCTEDKIREKEWHGDFDKEFIKLARSVYKMNDKRSRIKKEINMLTRSSLVEDMGRTKILLGKDNHQLGDTIGWMGQVERYQRASQEEVHVFCNFSNLFGAQNLHVYSVDDPLWYESFDKKFIIDFYPNTRERPSILTNKIHHIKESGLIQTASEILGFDQVKEIKPTIGLKPKLIKTKKPIVTLASLSTMQQKMWNYKNGWNEVISYLKKNRIDVVSIDQYARFGAGYPLGDIPAFNPIPSRSIDKTGEGLRIAASYIKKSIFHMGLSSGGIR